MRMLGTILIASVALLATGPVPARAEHPAECRAGDSHLNYSYELPNVAKALARKRLDILVVGAGSSTLPGAGGAGKAFPARLQDVLAEKFPGVAVKVATDIKAGRTATDAVPVIRSGLAAKPVLLIWQTGTVDAMKSVELEDFSAALERGVAAARSAGSDIILVNGQYSPRTESIIALGTYVENMRWVALQREIPLLDRFSIMKLWSELGTFDFVAATKKLDIAERVHDCIGRLLGELVVEGSKSGPPPGGAR